MGIESLASLKDKISKTPTTEILDVLFEGAVKSRASDIHFEPEEKGIRLRFRIDGFLEDALTFKKEDYPALLNRIKLRAGLKINIHESGQDGRFTIKSDGAEIEIRTSVLPGAYGENVALRVLDPKTIIMALEDLGMTEEVLE